jgi:hypothetical protein
VWLQTFSRLGVAPLYKPLSPSYFHICPENKEGKGVSPNMHNENQLKLHVLADVGIGTHIIQTTEEGLGDALIDARPVCCVPGEPSDLIPFLGHIQWVRPQFGAHTRQKAAQESDNQA